MSAINMGGIGCRPMQQIGQPSPYGLEMHGIRNTGNVYWNLSTPAL